MTNETDISHELKVDLSTDSRETFIPIRHSDLIQRLRRWYGMREVESESFLDLCDRMQSIFHVEHLSAMIGIDDLYGPLDPDSELIQTVRLDEDDLTDRVDQLFDRVSSLAYAAHYQRLSRDELKRMIKLGSQGGVKLEVDFDVFEQLEIFARGYRMVDVKRRRWQNFFRRETIKLPEFHRLILTFRLKSETENQGENDKKKKKRNIDKSMRSDAVYIKNFKNIPETDLEVLLPGTRVKLSRLDQGKVLLPAITGAAIKTGPAILTLVFRLFGFAAIGATGALAIFKDRRAVALFAVVMIGYIGKSVFTYFRTKDKYEFTLTKNLYLKNLDNNAGVLYRLLNEAQEQELCETILGYTVLWQQDSNDGLEEIELDELAEKFLIAETSIDVDFDLHDAVGKLARLGLAIVDASGRWKAVPIESAAGSLTENWERLFKKRVKAHKADGLDENLMTS